ncbi:unnamed protein product [Rotaria sp. Silwood1]|nr:unnamed protein product [Rotaria sp. Silwood1]
MAVGCLRTKLRLGLSNNVLATLFSFSNKRTVGRILESARQALVEDFVPKHLGFGHISRKEILQNHTRPLAKHLLTGARHDISKMRRLSTSYMEFLKDASSIQYDDDDNDDDDNDDDDNNDDDNDDDDNDDDDNDMDDDEETHDQT